MAETESWAELEEIVIRCVTELFGHRGLELRRGDVDDVDLSESGDELVGILGFSGEELRGSAVIKTGPGVLRRTIPTKEAGANLGDWIGELANQLVGRIKNRTAALGLDFRLGEPRAVWGSDLRVVQSRTTLNLKYRFDSDAGVVEVWFDMLVYSGVLATRKPPEPAAAEGDVLVF